MANPTRLRVAEHDPVDAIRQRVELNELRARDIEARLRIARGEMKLAQLRDRLQKMKGRM